jgi:hypothetical protein
MKQQKKPNRQIQKLKRFGCHLVEYCNEAESRKCFLPEEVEVNVVHKFSDGFDGPCANVMSPLQTPSGKMIDFWTSLLDGFEWFAGFAFFLLPHFLWVWFGATF